jgi:hypothetical protein
MTIADNSPVSQTAPTVSPRARQLVTDYRDECFKWESGVTDERDGLEDTASALLSYIGSLEADSERFNRANAMSETGWLQINAGGLVHVFRGEMWESFDSLRSAMESK